RHAGIPGAGTIADGDAVPGGIALAAHGGGVFHRAGVAVGLVADGHVVVALQVGARVAAHGHVVQAGHVRAGLVADGRGLVADHVASGTRTDGDVAGPVARLGSDGAGAGTRAPGNPIRRARVGPRAGGKAASGAGAGPTDGGAAA